MTAPQNFSIRFAYYIVGHTTLANVNLIIDGFDDENKKVPQAVYHFGGANWDWGNEKPKQISGFYAINFKLPSEAGKWLDAQICPPADVNRIHGIGTWEKLKVSSLRVAVRDWAYEGGARSAEKNHYIEAFVDGIRLLVRQT